MTDIASTGYLAGLVVALVLSVAAGAKAGRTDATEASFRALGLPVPSALARLVPATELLVAVALALFPRVGAGAAVGLLLAFTLVLARSAARGGGVTCACFGSVRAQPVSAVEFVRNAFLLAGAGTALTAARPVAPTTVAVSAVGTASVVAAAVLALLAHRRRIRREPTTGSRGGRTTAR